MTEVATLSADWSFMNDAEAVAACDAAARIVSGKYKGRAVASLAEREDLRQEALILMATRPALRQYADYDQLRYALVRDLTDLSRRGYRHSDTESLDAQEG